MPYRPSPRQLSYLCALAESGSMSAAARLCHVSQPTLSTQFRLLEDQLGVTLAERSNTRVRLTPAGERLLPRAQQILNDLDELVEAANEDKNSLGGLIRLGIAPTFGPYFLPRFLPDIHARYPALKIYVREDKPQELETTLAAGHLDIIATPLPLSADSLEAVALCRESVHLAVPAEHALARKKAIFLRDLAGENLLTLGRGHRLFDQVQDICDRAGASMRIDYEGTSLDALRQMVSIGMGLSLFPSAYIHSECRRDPAVRIFPITDYPMQRTLILAWRKGSGRRKHFQTLADHARSTASGLSIDGLFAIDE